MRGSGRKGWGRALAPLLVLFGLTFPSPGQCEQLPAPILIVTPANTNPLLEEGVVRVRGELSALGLPTETQTDSKAVGSSSGGRPSHQGTLVFERFGDWLRIQAWNPNLAQPVTQWIDTSDPTVDAEVLAVRAVDALRAVLLPYLRRPPEEKPGTSRLPPPPATPAPTSTSRAPELPPPLGPAPSSRRSTEARELDDEEEVPPGKGAPSVRGKRPGGGVWLGPALGFDLGADTVNYGAQAGFSYGVSWLVIGARFEITQATLPVEAGRIQIRRFGVMADARARVALLEKLDAYAALGAGVQLHRVEGIAAPGYDGYTTGHTSLAFLAEVGGQHWFTPRLALYVSARTTLSADAPVVLVDQQRVGTLNRPELAFSSGLVLGLD